MQSYQEVSGRGHVEEVPAKTDKRSSAHVYCQPVPHHKWEVITRLSKHTVTGSTPCDQSLHLLRGSTHCAFWCAINKPSTQGSLTEQVLHNFACGQDKLAVPCKQLNSMPSKLLSWMSCYMHWNIELQTHMCTVFCSFLVRFVASLTGCFQVSKLCMHACWRGQ